MSLIAIVVSALAIGVAVLISIVVLLVLTLRRIWRWTRPDQLILRSLIVAVGLVLVAAPYIAIQIANHNFILARVPKPLKIATIEYRQEESWGLGFMPGDNETGFVVYRLTNDSADLARRLGNRLDDILEEDKGAWRPTPVDDESDGTARNRWHPDDPEPRMMTAESTKHRLPDISEYLGKYGFDIPIDEGRIDEFNRSIRSNGSFYRYGEGGSVTIVDPNMGKVYFAYAG